MSGSFWDWAALAGLGAYHGINPGMGWLFSVALGMQEKSRSAVWKSLLPIAAGHGLAIGVVLLVAGLASAAIPFGYVRITVAVVLIALGALRLVRHGHPRWFGMTVGFGDLTLWSFLMATGHGAGLMLLPVLLHMSGPGHHGGMMPHAFQRDVLPAQTILLAALMHSLSYLLVMGAVAIVVYERLGLALLRKAWVNLDVIWAAALILSGGLVFLLPS